MRYCFLVLALASATVVMTACQQERAGGQPQQPPVREKPQGSEEPLLLPDDEPPLLLDDEPPLLLDDEPPLLLDDDPEESEPADGPVADNSRCQVCHLDLAVEELAVVHAEANIGCAKCHGNCDEHIADESWASGGNGTPPEIMYPKEKINSSCLDCHPEGELSKLEHKRFFAGTAGEKYCTSCHGEHRMVERKCKWK